MIFPYNINDYKWLSETYELDKFKCRDIILTYAKQMNCPVSSIINALQEIVKVEKLYYPETKLYLQKHLTMLYAVCSTGIKLNSALKGDHLHLFNILNPYK